MAKITPHIPSKNVITEVLNFTAYWKDMQALNMVLSGHLPFLNKTTT